MPESYICLKYSASSGFIPYWHLIREVEEKNIGLIRSDFFEHVSAGSENQAFTRWHFTFQTPYGISNEEDEDRKSALFTILARTEGIEKMFENERSRAPQKPREPHLTDESGSRVF